MVFHHREYKGDLSDASRMLGIILDVFDTQIMSAASGCLSEMSEFKKKVRKISKIHSSLRFSMKTLTAEYQI